MSELTALKQQIDNLDLRTASGQVIAMLVEHLDMVDAENKRLRDQLQSIRQRQQMSHYWTSQLSGVFHAIPDAVSFADPDRTITLVNPAFTELFGYEPEEVIGESTRMLYANVADFERRGRQRSPDNQQRLPSVEEVNFTRKSGETFVGQSIGSPVYDDQSRYIGYVAIVRDLTEQHALERHARERDHFYRLLARNMPDAAVCIFDHDLRLIMVEGSLLPALGFNPTDVEGRSLYDVLPAEIVEIGEPFYRDALKGEDRITDVSIFGRYLYQHTLPVRDETGEIVAGMVVAHDVTREREAEHHERQLLLERERGRLLKNFIQDTSHDFLTPLTVMKTSLFLLRSRIDAEVADDHVHKIDQQLDRLSRLVNNMIEMARLEDVDNLSLTPLDANMLVLDRIARMKATAEVQGIRLTSQLADDKLVVSGDSPLLGQVIDELIRNALRHTSDGGEIRFTTERTADRITISVQDTGTGIPDADLPRIFDHFYRADASRSTSTGGTGLGLPMARRIITLHGGSLTAHSRTGQGSTFRIVLPVADR